ncbi:hypothetical protein C5748_19875 [Phyllobacterium phragmitis]|uniref:DUF3311 domain-containing protein n=1 Tax=Phyllobacterium phragmitis TaxID=2670329 RepID=A0A2S9IMG7_9HYPH|nr:hypothetical protein [Phyllobacterium phragmitis]PRD41724.1 hypothetical protein C5748_19875 [Phyllobacterium phragmitis]
MRKMETGRRGGRDAATVLPFLLAILLAPPIILVFAAPVTIVGIPLMAVYLFGVWAVAVLAAFFLSQRLAETETPPGQASPGEGKRH